MSSRQKTRGMVAPPSSRSLARAPSMAELQFKLTRIVSRHEQLKTAFGQLQSQIRFGLLEAEEVFASLAVPLMKLVGLKTDEMAKEGRLSTIVMNSSNLHAQMYNISESTSETRERLAAAFSTANLSRKISRLEEETYTNRATEAGEELMQKQQLQLAQLIHLLRQIETQVNSSHSIILQTLADHLTYIHQFFQKAITYIWAIHQSNQSSGACPIMLKLLKGAFSHVGAALSSVEDGVGDLMHGLARKMCIPMVEYVKGLKAEMTAGTCTRLLIIVQEMGEAMRDGRRELEEVRKKAIAAEEKKLEALISLRESEESLKKIKEQYVPLLEDKKVSLKHLDSNKLVGTEEGQSKDEKKLWELLMKKRKYQPPESPLGPNGLLFLGSKDKRVRSTRTKPSICQGPVKTTNSRVLSPKTPCLSSRVSLGSSPTAAPPTNLVPQAHDPLNPFVN